MVKSRFSSFNTTNRYSPCNTICRVQYVQQYHNQDNWLTDRHANKTIRLIKTNQPGLRIITQITANKIPWDSNRYIEALLSFL